MEKITVDTAAFQGKGSFFDGGAADGYRAQNHAMARREPKNQLGPKK